MAKAKLKSWLKSKTLWAALVTALTGVGMYFTGEQALEEFSLTLVGVVFALLRVLTAEPIK